MYLGFKNIAIASAAVSAELQRYLTIAERIRSDPNFANSNVRRLEKYILDANECIRQISSNPLHNADTAFFAIAAPSLEGKTQSACVFKDLKPLYFPLTPHEQLIYQNFTSLSETLGALAASDVSNIRRNGSQSPDFISATDIRQFHSDVKLWTLGFLVRLVQISRLNFSSTSQIPWMQYLSQLAQFDFPAYSYSEFVTFQQAQNFNFSGFCLFLDEFVGADWAVYVRNLARLIGLRCVVSNTNARIGNLVGKSSSSGATVEYVWSIVITRLDASTVHILDENNQLSSSIAAIQEMSGNDPAVRMFLEHFVSTQISYLRPGLAVVVVAALAEFVLSFTNHRTLVDLNLLLTFISSKLASYICGRKPAFVKKIEASYGNIGLFLSESYVRETGNEKTNSYFNGYRFLEFHLYYLRNPHKADGWIFLTFPPEENKQDLRIPRDGQYKSWVFEYTFFNENELLGILGCMFIPFTRPITSLLVQAQEENSSHSSHAGDHPNPEARKLLSNPLEASAAVSVVDASHHLGNDYVNCSPLSGQTGTNFLNNLIENLLEDHNDAKGLSINRQFIYPRAIYDLKNQFLNQCRIPYLYSINRQDLVLEGIEASNISLAQYYRASDNEEIDGRFWFRFSNEPALSQATVECKNHNNRIGSGILVEILEKCILNDSGSKPSLSLVFCREFVEWSTKMSKFSELCRDQMINVYRVYATSSSKMHFEIKPFSSSFQIHSNPNLICILLEADRTGERGFPDPAR